MKILRQLLLGILIAIVGAGIVTFAIITRGESLYDCKFELSADKAAYKVDDVIVLTAQITPSSARSLTVSEDLCNNLSLWNVEFRKQGLPCDGRPVRRHFTPGKPLQFQIRGKCTRHEDGTVWLDFGDYGRASIRDNKFPPLRFVVLPYRIPMQDSVEWGSSNELQLRFEP